MRSRGHPAVLGASLPGPAQTCDPRRRVRGNRRRRGARPGPAPADDGSGSSSEDEDSKAANLARMSAEAKRKGNEAFAAGDYAKAAKQFTMAIRMDKNPLSVSEPGSAARCGLGSSRRRWRTRSGRGGAEVGEGVRAKGRGADGARDRAARR